MTATNYLTTALDRAEQAGQDRLCPCAFMSFLTTAVS